MSRKTLHSGMTRSIGEEPTINLTPLIDVVFVILIMFILIAPFFELDRIELAHSSPMHQESSGSVQEAGPIAIQVDRNNRISYNHQPVDIDQLREFLKKAKQDYLGAKPQLFHDKQGHFGVYQSIKNAVEEAGFDQMDVILRPE